MHTMFRQILRPRTVISASRLQFPQLRQSSSNDGTSEKSGPTPQSPAQTISSQFTKDVLDQMVHTNKVVIFMKGNPEAPRCGFSNAVVQILRMHGVNYDAHDVLQNEELRQSIKSFSDWPTIPQVFINGEFVGGCDILLQMHQSGDLIEELKKVGIESALLKNAQQAETTTTTDTQQSQK